MERDKLQLKVSFMPKFVTQIAQRWSFYIRLTSYLLLRLRE